ncbi:MAG: hypothetical protein HYX72_03610 [Acidobacteria bacterium]|nr:hypothetical protein [Acidobacteriota bacterium]
MLADLDLLKSHMEPSDQEERSVAEDFRRQLQERLPTGPADRSKEDALRRIDKSVDLLTEINTVSWGRESSNPSMVEQLRKELESIPLMSPRDEPFTHAIMKTLCENVESACRTLGIPLRSGVAYGSSPTLAVDAAHYRVHFTDASVITLSAGFISFCSHISKMFSLSLEHEQHEKTFSVCFKPNRVFAKIGSDPALKYYWTEIIGAYAFGSGPLIVKQRLVPSPASITRVQLLQGMELFSVAHEYAHHIGSHGDGVATAEDSNAKREEYEADSLALTLSRYIGANEQPQNLYAMSGASAVLLLKCHECVRRARQILRTGSETIQSSRTHPNSSDRIAAFDAFDEHLPKSEREMFKQTREDFEDIIDAVWAKLRPWYVEMHNHGLRPAEDSSVDSWLPT